MKSFPPDIERLLEAERHAPDPSAETRARVHRKVEISVGLAAATTAAAAAAHASTSAATSAAATSAAAKTAALAGKSLLAKLLIGAAVSATVVGGGVYLATQKQTPMFAAPQPVESETTHEAHRTPVEPVLTVPSLPPPHRPPPHPAAPFMIEQNLIEQARAAMAAGAPGRALMLLQQHERQFPAGQLAEARESLAIQALVADGHRDLAHQRATEFRRRYPHSLFQPAVDASLSH